MRTAALGRALAAGMMVAACAAGASGPAPLRGTSGPVAWEVVDVRQTRPDQYTVRWDYTVVLRETAGVGIDLERIDMGAPETSGRSTSEFRQRLPANSELRLRHSYGALMKFGDTTFGRLETFGGAKVIHRYSGRDDAGKRVTIDVPIHLDWSMGK
jgi:hypothetical protein